MSGKELVSRCVSTCSAILKGYDFSAMNNLAIIIRSGADGVDKDVVCAVSLYYHAIYEGYNCSVMYSLAVHSGNWSGQSGEEYGSRCVSV